MNLAQILILGLVQGLTEFLPISSTAHLILLPWFFKFPDPGLIFDIALHLGTLLAIVIYFCREWREIIMTRHPLLIFILIATIPGVIFGGLLESKAETIFRTPPLLAATLVVFGLILWFVDKNVNHPGDLSNLNRRKAFFIGLWQALAIIPGVSRSGATITAGLLAGLKREAAVKFSFLLSAPIIFGSVLAASYKLIRCSYKFGACLPAEAPAQAGSFLIGTFASFMAGLLAIKFLLGFVKDHSFLPFVIYRLIIAAAIIVFLTAKI